MSLEISFEKRYVLIYSLIVATTHYIISKINNIFGEVFSSIWAIDIIVLIMVLLVISIFDRNQKERIALGFLYIKQPFEKGDKWIVKDKRITKEERERLIKELTNISNAHFFSNYYNKVKKTASVIAKNSEYCVIRDITLVLFFISIFTIILTIVCKGYFWKEIIASCLAYLIGVVSCRKKSKDFVCQIIVEYKNLEEVIKDEN